MKLTLEKFFSRLIFHPFEADTKKDKAIALIASIACGIFLIGICYAACRFKNCFNYRPSDKATQKDRRVSRLRDSVLETPPSNNSGVQAKKPKAQTNKKATIPSVKTAGKDRRVSELSDDTPLEKQSSNKTDVQAEKTKVETNIKVKIFSGVIATLNKLFYDSPYSIDNLPIYPIILDKEIKVPERKKMTAPVMKGTCVDGRTFIVMKVDCDLRDEDIEKAGSHLEIQNHYKVHRQLKEILILYQSSAKDPLLWDQLGRGQSMYPSFFTWNFTYLDGSGPTETQKKNFKLVQTLLKTGKSKDTNGLIWSLSKKTFT